MIFKAFLRALDFEGRNPSKQNLSVGKPLITRAVVAAQGPGIQTTLYPFLLAADTSSSPGSLMTGSPASDIRAMVLPSLRS